MNLRLFGSQFGSLLSLVSAALPLLIWLNGASAQTVTTPAQNAIACAYNTAVPILTAGTYGLVQCDSAGRLVLGASTAVSASLDRQIAAQLTVQNAAYSASNAMGGTQTIALFRTAGAGARINTVTIQSKGGSTVGMTLYGTSRSPSWTCTDKSAFAESASDVLYRIPGFPLVLTPATAQGSTTTYASAPIYQTLQNLDASPGTNAYFCLVANGSVTPASTSDLILTFGVIQD